MAVTVFLGSLKVSELQIPQLPQRFMVLLSELRAGKSVETWGKSLLKEIHTVMKDGATQLLCHLDLVLVGRNYRNK